MQDMTRTRTQAQVKGCKWPVHALEAAVLCFNEHLLPMREQIAGQNACDRAQVSQ